jgi:prepilin-type N-terminal cleavage/methylation domain-containing protein
MIKQKSGFTLIELMVAIAILAVLVAISIPAYLSWRPNYRLRSAVLDLQTNMQLTRMEAIRYNQNCSINFNNPGTDQYTIPCLNNKTVTLADYTGGVTFGGAVATITFTSRGLCNPVAFTMTAPAANTSYSFRTATSGGVSVTPN